MLTLGVDVERLVAGGRMRPDNGMLVDDGVAPLDAAPGSSGVDLLDARVRGLEAVETLLEERAQTLVGRGGVDEERVTARVRPVEDVEERGAGGLPLVRDVRVPGDGAGPRLEEGAPALVSRAAVDEMHLRVALRRARGRVDVVTAEVAAVLQGLGDGQVGKVLAAEGDDLALSDEAGELVLAGIVQAGELDAADFGADGGREVVDSGVAGEEVGEGRVGVLAVLIVLEVLEGRVLLLWVPGRKIVGVLPSC